MRDGKAAKRCRGCIVGMPFQFCAQLEDRHSIKWTSAQAVQPMQNAQANRGAAAQTAGLRNFFDDRTGKWKWPATRPVEKRIGRVRHNLRRLSIRFASDNAHVVVNAERYAEAVEPRAKVGSAGGNPDRNLLYHHRKICVIPSEVEGSRGLTCRRYLGFLGPSRTGIFARNDILLSGTSYLILRSTRAATNRFTIPIYNASAQTHLADENAIRMDRCSAFTRVRCGRDQRASALHHPGRLG